MWVVVKIMVPFWVLNIIQHLILRDPAGDHNFDNHPCLCGEMIWVYPPVQGPTQALESSLHPKVSSTGCVTGSPQRALGVGIRWV